MNSKKDDSKYREPDKKSSSKEGAKCNKRRKSNDSKDSRIVSSCNKSAEPKTKE